MTKSRTSRPDVRAAWLGLLLVAALAEAAPFVVEPTPIDLLHAERVDLTERFELVSLATERALVGSTKLDGVEISELMTPATTHVSRGHWTHTVVLRERTPDAVPLGAFDVMLKLDGRAAHTVRLAQNVSNPILAEGARVTFDLGFDLPPAPLFVLTMTQAPIGQTVTLTSAINEDLLYVWRDGAQNENPTIQLTTGVPVTFEITNGDGTSPHNLQIPGGGDPMPESEDVVELGDETTLAWTPPAAGTYVYECRYHDTMRGTIEVTE